MSTVSQPDDTALSDDSVEISPCSEAGRQLEFDDRGRAILPTEAEQAEDLKALLLALERNATIPDDPPGSDEELWRAIDAGRPERPLFQEFYAP